LPQNTIVHPIFLADPVGTSTYNLSLPDAISIGVSGGSSAQRGVAFIVSHLTFFKNMIYYDGFVLHRPAEWH